MILIDHVGYIIVQGVGFSDGAFLTMDLRAIDGLVFTVVILNIICREGQVFHLGDGLRDVQVCHEQGSLEAAVIQPGDRVWHMNLAGHARRAGEQTVTGTVCQEAVYRSVSRVLRVYIVGFDREGEK